MLPHMRPKRRWKRGDYFAANVNYPAAVGATARKMGAAELVRYDGRLARRPEGSH